MDNFTQNNNMNNSQNSGQQPPYGYTQNDAPQGNYQNAPANQPYPFMNNVKPQKPFIRTTGFDKAALAATIVLLFLFFADMFSFDGTTGWVWTILYTVMMIFSGAYVAKKRNRIEVKALPSFIAGVALSFGYALHSSSMNLSFVCLVFLTATYLVTLSGAAKHSKSSAWYLLDIIHCFIFAPFAEFLEPFRNFSRTKKEKRMTGTEQKRPKTVLYVILGVVCGIIVLCAVIPLLGESVPGFEDVLETIFGNFFDSLTEYSEENIAACILALIVTAIVFPIVFSSLFGFAHGGAERRNRDTSASWMRARKAPQAFFVSLLSVVSVVYIIYTVLQISYMFSAFAGKLPSNSVYSTSEYARRGFAELIVIAFINLALITLTVLFAKRKNDNLPAALKIINIFLCLFTMFITVVSASKIILYMNTYGLTDRRIVGFAGDVVLFSAFLFIMLRLIIRKFPYMTAIMYSAVIVIMALGLCNTGKIIASVDYNICVAGETTDEIDPWILHSNEGFEYLIKLSQQDGETGDDAKVALVCFYDYEIKDKINDDGSIKNIFLVSDRSEYLALKLAGQNKLYLDELSDYYASDDCDIYVEY